MLISEELSPSMIKIGLEATTKEELFEEMVQMFVSEGLVFDRDAAVMTLLEREAKMSTGVAPGFALPHGKLVGVQGVIMGLGILKEEMDYDSLDDEPVSVVMTLFCEPGNPAPHLSALSEISRLLMVPGFVNKLKKAKTPEEALKIIKECEG